MGSEPCLQTLLSYGFDSRRAISPRKKLSYRVHCRQRRCARREGEEDGFPGSRRDSGQHIQHVIEPVVDERIHADDVIEGTQTGIKHVAHPEFHTSSSRGLRQTLIGKRDQGWRKIDRNHVSSSRRCGYGKRTRPAACVENATP